MNHRRLVIVWIGLLLLLLTLPAQGARYDLDLSKYYRKCIDIDPAEPAMSACANKNFKDLITELGLITAPVFLAPGETLGLNGFEFSFEGSIVPLHPGRDHWTWTDNNNNEVSVTEGKPQSVLFIPHLHMRKGLPFSFEIGAQLSYVPESELFVVGAEVKWALNEGFYYIPDLAVRFAFDHIIGSKDFELTTGGWDVSLSKAFGIGGMLSLTPYAGYNMLFIHASSHVVIYQPDPVADPTNWDQRVFDTVNWNDNMQHRFFVGCRMKTYIFQVVVEGSFASHSVNVFSFKLGFDY